jgi:hypothetical protein
MPKIMYTESCQRLKVSSGNKCDYDLKYQLDIVWMRYKMRERARTSEGCLERLEERHTDYHEGHHNGDANKH